MREPSMKVSSSRRRGLLGAVATGVHMLVLLAAIGLVGYAASPFLEGLPRGKAPSPAMEDVDWTSPYSSIYCLSCHRQVAPAMAGMDVEQGHSHNVLLDSAQIDAVRAMGTLTGPEGLLICLSCHELGQTNPHMLADTLTDSRLCRRCHPQQFTMVGTKHDLRISAPHERNRFGQTADTGGPCSACHLSHHYAREFEPSELDPDGRCVTCHQIGRAAAKLARPTMEHPDTHCVICHNPHDQANAHFLKKPGAAMCTDCHKGFADGPARGMHPLGPMPCDVPQSLVAAGAETFGHPRELTCLACHSTHSSTHGPLLVMPADTNDLCMACHRQQLTELAFAGQPHKHARSPILTPEQRAVVEDRGGRVGPGGELLCVSCHAVHEADPSASLLAAWMKSPDACTACHADKKDLLGTPHDLRTRLLGEPTAAGAAVRSAGACGACHAGHGPTLQPTPTAGDVAGQCATCHRKGGLAQANLHASAGHSSVPACGVCHDPHGGRTSVGDFLRQDPAEACRSCHPAQHALAGGPHDPSKDPARWAAHASGGEGLCLTCHVWHGAEGTGLFRTAAAVDSYHDAVCLECHRNAAWNASSEVAAIHPQRISPGQERVPVSLVPVDEAGQMRMGCRTCHNVHGGADPGHLARVQPGEPTAGLCTHCHADMKRIELTSHAPARLAKAGFETDSCKPCHAMHARPEDTWGLMLSPRFLGEVPAMPADSTDAGLPCLVCHRAGGPAPLREVSSHPQTFMRNTMPPDGPGHMPLFGQDGRIDPQGQITCRTCHLSHGQEQLLDAAAGQPATPPDAAASPAAAASPDAQPSAGQAATPADARRSAVNNQVRPFVEPNLCTQCHGADARRLFLFFHDASKRRVAKG